MSAMPKHSKHKRKHESERHGEHRASKIASAIAKGDTRRAHELLLRAVAEVAARKLDDAALNPLQTTLKAKAHRQIAAGSTLLHVAAQCGDVHSIEVLLANGCDVNALDEMLRTPLHVAGAEAARAMLAAAAEHGLHVDLKACDASGCSVDEAIWMALRDADEEEQGDQGDNEDAAEEDKVRRARAVYGGGEDDYEGGACGRRTTREDEEEREWQAKLREESDFEREEASVGGFGPWGDDGSGGGNDGEGGDEDGDDWFTAVAAQMAARNAQRAREAQERAEAAAAAAWGARMAERRGWGKAGAASATTDAQQGESARASAAEAAERQRRADEAFRRLQQQQQQARDHAARAEARARYIAAWLRLQPPQGQAADQRSAPLRMADFPWPCRAAARDQSSASTPGPAAAVLTADEVAFHVFGDEMLEAQARRKALQSELRRWHPDKFEGRYGALIAEEAREAVLLRVKAVAQCLTELMGRA